MTRNELEIALQAAIDELNWTLRHLSESREEDTSPKDELVISLQAGVRSNEIVVWDDQALFLGPQYVVADELQTLHLGGRPAGLPLRTCPRCHGSGTV